MNLVKLNKSDILDIYSDMSKYKSMSRAEVLSDCIQSRLRASLLRYNLELDLCKDYLNSKWPYQVLSTIRRMQKVSDKEEIEANLITEKEFEEDIDTDE